MTAYIYIFGITCAVSLTAYLSLAFSLVGHERYNTISLRLKLFEQALRKGLTTGLFCATFAAVLATATELIIGPIIH